MDIGRAFSAIFEDQDWIKKVLMGGLFFLLIVTIPASIGYALRWVRGIVEGDDRRLPEWDNFGELWIQGLVAICILFLWALPGALLSRIPCAGAVLGILWQIATMFVFAYIWVRFATTQNFSVAFEFQEMIAYIQGNIGNVALAVIMQIVFSLAASLGVIALIIGVAWTGFFALLASSHIYAQAWRSYYQTPAAPAFAGVPPAGAPPTEPPPPPPAM